MADGIQLTKAMRRNAIEAVELTKPVNICFGEVIETSPLQIEVEQKMILGESHLILSRNVTDYVTEVTIQWETLTHKITHNHNIDLTDSNGDTVTGTTESKSISHTHDLEGRKQMTIHNALQKGEKVILLRQQRGHKFVVWDRIG